MPKPANFNRKRAIEKDEVYFFYDADDILSNVADCPVYFNGYNFKSSEHAYHAQKFDPVTQAEIFQAVLNAPDGVTANQVAESYSEENRADWESVKLGIMINVVRAKIAQNVAMQEALLETGDKILFEDAPDDANWGMITRRGITQGKNWIGRILMIERARLQRGEYNQEEQ